MFSSRRLRQSGLAATGFLAAATAAGPCDIYASGNTPCVAAHSTTRALYSNYNGPLYQVVRNSDGSTINISPLAAGGVANAAAQDNFCAQTTCNILTIYDQSGHGNNLSRAPGGAFKGPQANGDDDLASAIGAPVTLNGNKAYGVFVSPGTGYRIDQGNSIPTGDAAEGMYAVLDGTHYNDQCCFDYGNAETSNTDTGNAHMEAIYYGSCTVWDTGAGSGPWIMADLENGLFSGSQINGKSNADPSQSSRFLTTVVKGKTGLWAIRGGNAASGSLSTYYSGARPSGYQPMYKEGSIILGIGGDNSNGAQGTFYEGVMTTGYPSDQTEASVQANIVAAKYAVASLNSGTAALTVGSTKTFHVTTSGYTNRFLAHSGSTVNTQIVSSSSSAAAQNAAKWIVRAGLAQSSCFSFESADTAGSYIHHNNFQLYLNANDGSKQFAEDATFCTQNGLSGQGTSIRSWNFPTRYIRHYNNVGYIASQGGPHTFDATGSYNADVTFLVGTGF